MKANFGAVPESELKRIEDALMESPAEAVFEPLDASVARDYELLRSVDVQRLLERWKGGIPGLPSARAEEWKRSLTVDVVSHHCAAMAALMKNALLWAFRSADEARGSIGRSPEPYFRVYPEPNSLLAQEQELKTGEPAIYGCSDFAQQIALRCGVEPEFGELSWRALAACLTEQQCAAVLPGISVRATGSELEVRLRG